jgi:hypothetical protein
VKVVETGSFAEQALAPRWLLEGDFERHQADVAADEAIGCLRFIARARARIELDLGRGLALFGRGKRFDHGVVGHSHFDDFCSNRLGFSGGAARELRSMSAALETLPRLREAFLAALLTRTKLRPLIGFVTVEDEAGWAQQARRLGTRDLGKLVEDVRAGRRKAPAVEVEEEVFVSWRASALERSLWRRHGLGMLRTIVGQKGPTWQLAEALAANTLLLLEGGPPAPEELSPFVQRCVREAKARVAASERAAQRRGRRRRAPCALVSAKLARKLRRALGRVRALPSGPPATDVGACTDAWSALAELQRLCRERDALDCERAFVLDVVMRHSLHRALGFRSFDAFVEQGLGLAPRDAFAALALVRQLVHLPEIACALRAGRISQRDAEQLLEVADPATELEWLRYAHGATRKLLGDAVSWAAAEDARRLSESEPRTQAILPPWHLTPSQLQADWIERFASREQRARHRERLAAAGVDVRADLEPEDDPQLAVIATAGGMGAHLRPTRTGFWAPVGVASQWWTAVERVRAHFGATLTDADCVHVMLGLFGRSHLTPVVERHMRKYKALLRDGHRCTTPGCTAIVSLEEHHLWFRSHGGPDELWNLSALCRGCHTLNHLGLISAKGRAPDDITWTIGRGEVREIWRNERRVGASAAQVIQ